jgi:hypothetical protein
VTVVDVVSGVVVDVVSGVVVDVVSGVVVDVFSSVEQALKNKREIIKTFFITKLYIVCN